MKIIRTNFSINENNEYQLGRTLEDEIYKKLCELFGKTIYTNKLLEVTEGPVDEKYGTIRKFYMTGYLMNQSELKEIIELIRIMKFSHNPEIRKRVLEFEVKFNGGILICQSQHF